MNKNLFIIALLAFSIKSFAQEKQQQQDKKEILQKVQQFFAVICGQDLKKSGFVVTRSNMEEIVLMGPEGTTDVRVVNSYPSKVC